MTDSPYHRGEQGSLTDSIDWSSMGDHDSVYSNPYQAAELLVERDGEEYAREFFAEKGLDEEEIDELIASVEGNDDEAEGNTADRQNDLKNL